MSLPSVCFVAPRVYLIASGDAAHRFAGGAEVQQTHIARGLVRAGHEVTVLAGDYGQPDETEIDGIRFIKLREKGRSIPVLRYFHPRLTSLWQGMQRADADIYYQRCSAAATFVTGLFARVRNKKFVFAAAHDLDLEKPRTHELFPGRGGWRDRQLYFMGLKMAHAVVAQHPGQQDSYRKWHGRDAVWIPSCSASPPNPVNNPSGPVLWVSMIRTWKRPELMFQLAESLPHVRFRMIGGMSSRTNDVESFRLYHELEERARRLPNLEFLGFLPYHEVDRHFDEASLFINTSDYEGFPNTFLQAWARGIPTVSFVDCGAEDSQGRIGFVARDQEDMRQTVSRLLADRLAWQQESARCQVHFQDKHSVQAVVARYQALFQQLRTRAA